MKFTLILAAFVATSSAHMRMSDPPAIHALGNPNGGNQEDQREPLKGPDQFPCRGHASALGSEAGNPVSQWEAGSTQKFKTFGAPAPSFQASHGGGSCQVSFSTDMGKTFKVVKSFIGGCPSLPDGGNVGNGEAHGTHIVNGYPFKVPKDLPTGPVLFAWTWFNNIGNREMYMNCAAIEITGETGEDDTMKFEDRPDIFVANLPDNAGECQVPPGSVNFPQPGPDVVVLKDATLEKHKIVEPTGNCGEIKRDAKKVFMDSAQYLEMGSKVDSAGPAPGGASTQGSVTEVPADAGTADGNRKAENKQPAAPAAAPAAPAATPSGGTAKADACPDSENGFFNCVDGKTWSQCASGTWSAVQQVAPGTTCMVGKGPNIEIKTIPAAKRSVRFSQPHIRHANRHRS